MNPLIRAIHPPRPASFVARPSTRLLVFFILLSAFSLQPLAFAQGTAFTYQGRLTDAGGAPVSGAHDLRFTVYDAPVSGGEVAGPLTNAAVSVSDGLFTATIDFGPGVFNGIDLWLGVAVRPAGGGEFSALTPLQRITSTPYAVRAGGLNGLLPVEQLPVNVVTNGGNISGSFSGDGLNLTNVHAATLGGISSGGFWKTNGNTGANPTNGAFIGTTDGFPVEFKVGGSRALRLEFRGDMTYGGPAPNFIAGSPGNMVTNTAYGGFVGGGGHDGSGGTYFNRVLGKYAATLGGEGNIASGYASVAMGVLSHAEGPSSLALGHWARALGRHSTALSGYNVASGDNSLAMGDHSGASGNGSVAMGYSAEATNNGSFVWADSDGGSTLPRSFFSAAEDSFNIRARGGVWLDDDSSHPTDLYFGANARQMINLFNDEYAIGVQSSTTYFRSNGRFSWFRNGVHSDTQNDPGAGGSVLMTLNASGLTVNGTFVSASDRNVKAGFSAVDPQDILAKVAALPITRWHYTNDAATPHLGPVAQDFHAAFGVGPDDKHIATVDADGVALAAIQGLNQKVEKEVTALRTENAELKQRLEKLERLMNPENGGAR